MNCKKLVSRWSLNAKKTNYMLFHTHQNNIDYRRANIKLNGNIIERVDTFNFLGVILDKHMSWKAHTDMLSNKLSKYCGIMTHLKNYLTLYVLRTLYFSMMNSHLNYGSLAWVYACNRLIKIQKRSFRVITRIKYNAHTKPMFRGLEILNLFDMLFLSSMKFHYKYKHKKVSEDLIIIATPVREMKSVQTGPDFTSHKRLRNYLPGKIKTLLE